jgi:trehalose 6-phosphate synthase
MTRPQVIVLANRQPYRHDYGEQGRIVVRHSASGVVHAVEPFVSACAGVWVAHGAGSADRAAVEHRDGVRVPPESPAYRLRRVWLSEAEERGYYDGFANEGLWPLCHRAYVKPIFRSSDFSTYAAVNARFASAVCDETESESALVLVQDYHFALAPRLIRARLPESAIVTFWHIPWPHWRDFDVCPWADRLLEGLLGSTVLGFQTESDGELFMETAQRLLGADVDVPDHAIRYQGRRILVRSYPASIEWPSRWAARSPSIDRCRHDVRRELQLGPDVRLGVGVDRMDYTKGLEEKFAAVERLLERTSALDAPFTFVQLAQPTRSRLPAYRDLRARVVAAAGRVNERFGRGPYRPIVLLEGDHPPETVFRYLRAADLCFVASLQDGMNLVSKEFVSARDDLAGVLVLSRFTGAARELDGALTVNPLDVDGSAAALERALRMDPAEQRARMRRMRTVLSRAGAHEWAADILADAQPDGFRGDQAVYEGEPLSCEHLTTC